MPQAKVKCRRSKATMIRCAQCGLKVLRYASYLKKARKHFCSQQCRGLYQRKGRTLKCEHCGRKRYVVALELAKYRHHYCSRACCQAAHVVIVPCEQCGKPVRRVGNRYDKAFCDFACYSVWRRAGLYQAWKASARRAGLYQAEKASARQAKRR